MNILKLDRTLLVAELGMNHDGSFGQAKALVAAAAAAGADAVKIQTHIADAETLKNAPAPPYFQAESRHAYFTRTAFSLAQHVELKRHAHAHGVAFLSSPFSAEAVALLAEARVDGLKIPSGEVTNLPLLRLAARTRIPVLLSSGMSSVAELDLAVKTLRSSRGAFAVLQCTSMYPCPDESVGLNLIAKFKARYRCPIGLSDHTSAIFASIAAAVLGARIIERHFTLSKKGYGPDAALSLEPHEFRMMADGIRSVERVLAHPVDKDAMCRSLSGMKRVFEKSVVSLRPIAKGAVIGAADVGLKKPGGGIAPKDFDRVVGARARTDIPAHVRISRAVLRG